jgi:NADH-quinone oxidoreductase subunit J
MVLFLFVIMLLNPQAAEAQKRRWWVAALVGAALLSGELIALGLSDPHRKIAAAAEPGFGSPHALAQKLFADFVLPFEIASLLLLVALVGAVVLTRRGE